MSYISNKIQITDSYTFDDVLLLPSYADFDRSDISLETILHPKLKLKLPILSSPMDTVTESKMAIVLAKNGGLGIIHRNLTIQEQVAQIVEVKNTEIQNLELAAVDENQKLLVGAAVGPSVDFEERITALINSGVDLLVIDSAHGHCKIIIDLVKKIKELFPDQVVTAGNITTSEAARDLIQAGADILRVGMGPGSICTTRIVSGMGVPQLTAVEMVSEVAKKYGVAVIADGGIKQIGDIPKAIGFGANCVMLGSMLAGFWESPGELLDLENGQFKIYRGMGSVAAMRQGAASRYGQHFDAKKLVAEGVEGLVGYKGDVENFLYQLVGGLKSSLYYTGNRNLVDFMKKSKFIKISNSGLRESHPHTIKVQNGGESYL
jgi:IMP dehydrogenase